MEEILASIRRILNEDEHPVPLEEPPAESAPEEDVLLLDQSMMVSTPEPELGQSDEDDPAADPVAAEALAAPIPPVVRPAPEPEAVTDTPIPSPAVSPGSTVGLVAPEAAAAAASSVGSLMRTLAAGRATQVWSGGPTLEDLVRAELRPLLKEWLDSNLPPLVERLVRAEIERVVGRAVP